MISVCMIARNEESNIGPALDSILPIADEIIVNVNSTNDGTHEIVKEYQEKTGIVKHISYPWNDNFSEARNYSIDPAIYPWIVWMDADDRVPKKSVEDIRLLGRSEPDRAFFFRIRNTRTDGIQQGSEFLQCRMFPNKPGIRWEDRSHEQIGPALKKASIERIPVDIEIVHTGYNNAAKKRKKAARNLRLMEMETPKWPVDYSHRADAYEILGLPKKAIEWYLKAYNLPDIQKTNPDLYFSLPSRIGGQYSIMNDYETALKWFKKCDPQNIEGVYQMARCYEEMEKYDIAVNVYYKVLSLNKRALYVAMEFDACRLYTFHFLLRLLLLMKRHKDAVKLIADMTREYPNNTVYDYDL